MPPGERNRVGDHRPQYNHPDLVERRVESSVQAGFDGWSSPRTWFYRVAPNACLTALGYHACEVLPAGLTTVAANPHAPADSDDSAIEWRPKAADISASPAVSPDTATAGPRTMLLRSIRR